MDMVLKDGEKKLEADDELSTAAAAHFALTKERLNSQVYQFKHVNCKHGDLKPAN